MVVLRRGGRGGGGRGGRGGGGGGGRGRGRRPAGPFRLKTTLCAQGGRCSTQTLPVHTAEGPPVILNGPKPLFIKIEKSAPWLQKAVTGKVATKNAKALNLCPMLNLIKSELHKARRTD